MIFNETDINFYFNCSYKEFYKRTAQGKGHLGNLRLVGQFIAAKGHGSASLTEDGTNEWLSKLPLLIASPFFAASKVSH